MKCIRKSSYNTGIVHAYLNLEKRYDDTSILRWNWINTFEYFISPCAYGWSFQSTHPGGKHSDRVRVCRPSGQLLSCCRGVADFPVRRQPSYSETRAAAFDPCVRPVEDRRPPDRGGQPPLRRRRQGAPDDRPRRRRSGRGLERHPCRDRLFPRCVAARIHAAARRAAKVSRRKFRDPLRPLPRRVARCPASSGRRSGVHLGREGCRSRNDGVEGGGQTGLLSPIRQGKRRNSGRPGRRMGRADASLSRFRTGAGRHGTTGSTPWNGRIPCPRS